MKNKINNEFYNQLGDDWYLSKDDAIAILRIEQEVKNPWVEDIIKSNFSDSNLSVLDIGCGGGFLTNYLATRFKAVYGLDISKSTIEIAKERDLTNKVEYVVGDAYRIPFEDSSMDVVCVMDFLEHVEKPEKVIAECSRVLRPGGIFVFHTFNRNFLSWLIIIKFMEWFVPNYPENLHILDLFIKPRELEVIMKRSQLSLVKTVGVGPCFNLAFLKSIFTRKIQRDFKFKTSQNTMLGYMGHSRKNN